MKKGSVSKGVRVNVKRGLGTVSPSGETMSHKPEHTQKTSKRRVKIPIKDKGLKKLEKLMKRLDNTTYGHMLRASEKLNRMPAQNTTVSRYSKKHENKVSDYTKEPSSPAARLKDPTESYVLGFQDGEKSKDKWFRRRLDYILAVAEEVYPRDWYVRVRELKKLKREME